MIQPFSNRTAGSSSYHTYPNLIIVHFKPHPVLSCSHALKLDPETNLLSGCILCHRGTHEPLINIFDETS
jgi:hypothetical protein